ncbi:MAG: hypothetical protein AAF694_20495 [Bacteroidota bacterium]
MNSKTPLILLWVPLLFSSCLKKVQEEPQFEAPLFDNLGAYSIPISTDNPWAQKFFDQGINLTFGFNHDEAARAFKEAQRLDPNCAMAYWGHAYVLGPNYNSAMDPSVIEEAYEASQKAWELAQTQSIQSWEKAAIEALTSRYPETEVANRAPVDSTYSAHMRSVAQSFPANDFVQLLLAESIMDVHPWDLWERTGSPKPWTPEILELLETIISRDPSHPGAHHLYIHATEASKEPEKGLESAQKLASLVPGSGHLVHMPSHTFIRTGNYHQGTLANEQAVEVDSLYIVACNAQGIYPMVYYPHNIHFLAACAALEGQGEKAVNASYMIARNINQELMENPELSTLQHYWIIPLYVLVKFAQWDHILTYDEPKENLLYPRAIWHYARGMAHSGKGELREASQELEALKVLTADTLVRQLTIWDINSVGELLDIASRVLESKILLSSGKSAQAIKLLEEAVAIEDQLSYQEPPDWFFSVRHELGAALLGAKSFSQAEKVYREDLAIFPKNGWALNGLRESLIAQNKQEELGEIEKQLESAWQWADVELQGSQVNPETISSFAIHRVRPPLPREILAIRSICGF